MEYVNIEQNSYDDDFPRSLSVGEIDYILSYLPEAFAPDQQNANLIRESLIKNLRNILQHKKICPSAINLLIEQVVKQYYKSQVTPGTAIGLHAAESTAHVPMQMSLDSFKQAGEASNAATSVTAIEEILYAKKNREQEICTLHYKDKYLTYEQVLNSRVDIVECIIDDFLMKTKYNTTNATYSYNIDAYKHLSKKWWHSEFYITNILNQRVPQDDASILRLYFNLNDLYKYKVTLKDIVDKLNEIYEDLLNIIYGPMEDGIIDIEASIAYNTKSKNEKKKFDLIITDFDNEEVIDDDMVISSYYNNQLLPTIKKLKIKGVAGIKNLTPIVVPVLSVIVDEKRGWMVTGVIDDEILALFELLDIKILKQVDDYHIIELPSNDDFIQYIDKMINADKKDHPSNKYTKITKIVNKIKKLKYKSIYVTHVNKRKLYKLGIDIQRLIKLYNIVGMNTISTYEDDDLTTIVVDNKEKLAPKELTLAQIKLAKENYNLNNVYSPILNENELVTAEVEGKNLKGLLTLDFLDTHRTTSNNMHVLASVFGIEASQKFFIEELNRILANYGVHSQHVLTIAYLFFSRGVPSGAMTNSVKKPYGPIDQAAIQKSVDVLKSSALQGMTHPITGISTGIIFGLAPKVGTGYFNIGYAYDQNTILYNKDIYKSFKMDRDKIDQQQNEVVPIDSPQVDEDMNEALNYYGQKELSKTIKSKNIKPKVIPEQEFRPTIKSTKVAKQQTAMTVKSKYDI